MSKNTTEKIHAQNKELIDKEKKLEEEIQKLKRALEHVQEREQLWKLIKELESENHDLRRRLTITKICSVCGNVCI